MATEKVVYELSLRDLMTKGLNDINSKMGTMEGKLGQVSRASKSTGLGLGSMFGALAAGFASLQIAGKAQEIIMITAKFQSLHNSIKFASDGAIQGGASIIWLSQMSKKMGLEITGVTEGFKTFQGAMLKTKFSSGEVRNMFRQVSTGAVAMGLSADDTKGTFLALGQIMGKGKVQAEELRGQIGERIPGAFAIAARAVGVTTAELDKMMKDGKLISEDFLPKFAAEMEKTFGQGAIDNANSLTASINRMSNGWTELMVAIGSSQDGLGGVFDWIGDKLDKFADRFRTIEDLAKRGSNEKLVSYLDIRDKLSKSQSEGFQKKGLKGGALSDAIIGSGKGEYDRMGAELKAAKAKLNTFSSKILTAEGITGKMSMETADKKVGELILQKKQSAIYDSTNVDQKSYDEWSKQRENVQFLKDAQMGVRQVYDKTAGDAFKTSDAKSATADAAKLAEQSASVSGSVPKVVNINIEALIKEVNNYLGSADRGALESGSFLTQLEQALTTIVTDVGIVAQYGR